MANAGGHLRKGGRDAVHAARAHLLSQVTAGGHSQKPIVYAAHTAQWAPFHKLDRALRLDGSHGCVPALGHFA
eukprot:4515157-Lingulodinium_polyedra.AAC.1